MRIIRNFIYRLLFLAVILIVADQLFGVFFRPLFRRQERGKYFTTSHAIEGSAESIVIIGNSHAAQHFNANRIIDSLQVSAFNFGNQWQSMLYYYPVLESVLLHHHPKLIILNLDPDELLYNPSSYERLSILLPYFHANSYIDSAISLISPLERYKAGSHLYRFNSTIGYVLLNLAGNSYGKSILSRGFDPQDGYLCKLNADEVLVLEDIADSSRLDNIKVRFLQQIINDCKKRNIHLLVTFTPVYKGEIRHNFAYHTLTSILSGNQVEFRNYYKDERFCNDCTLFNDQNHLNVQGANMFTDIIIREIKERNMLAPVPHASQAISVK